MQKHYKIIIIEIGIGGGLITYAKVIYGEMYYFTRTR